MGLGVSRHHLKRSGTDERLSWRDSNFSVHPARGSRDRLIEPLQSDERADSQDAEDKPRPGEIRDFHVYAVPYTHLW